MFALAKILDVFAWMLGALAMSMGIVFLSTIGLFGFVWIWQGNSVLSLIWNFSEPSIVKGMAEVPVLAMLLGISAIALARRGHRRRQWSKTADWAVRESWWGFGSAGLSLSVLMVLFSCRLIMFAGL